MMENSFVRINKCIIGNKHKVFHLFYWTFESTISACCLSRHTPGGFKGILRWKTHYIFNKSSYNLQSCGIFTSSFLLSPYSRQAVEWPHLGAKTCRGGAGIRRGFAGIRQGGAGIWRGGYPGRCILAPPLHVPAPPLRIPALPLRIPAPRLRQIPATGGTILEHLAACLE